MPIAPSPVNHSVMPHNAGHSEPPPGGSQIRTARPAIDLIPVGLCVRGKAVLIVGAGRIAARKAKSYADHGARLTVVAPHHGPEMDALEIAVRHHRRFIPDDLDGQWLVVTATGDAEIDGAVYAEAEARQLWCNAADDPEHCSVVLPATVRRGDVTVAVSTGGRSPASASWLRRRIAAMLDEATVDVVDIAARVRDRMLASGQPTEVTGWAEILDDHAVAMAAAGRHAELETLITAAVGAPSETGGDRP